MKKKYSYSYLVSYCIFSSLLLLSSCGKSSENPILATPMTTQDPLGGPPPSSSGLLSPEEEMNSKKQRLVCIGGASASNLLTFTLESSDSALPSNTLLMDPDHSDFPLASVQQSILLDDPSSPSDTIRLSFVAQSLYFKANGAISTQSPAHLYSAVLNRKFRTTESRSLAKLASLNPKIAAAYRQIGLFSPKRYGLNLDRQSTLALTKNALEEVSLVDASAPHIQWSIPSSEWANPVANEKGILLEGLDATTGKIRKSYFARGATLKAQNIPAPTNTVSAWGGDALDSSRWFWFESETQKLNLVFWDSLKNQFIRTPILFEGNLITRSVAWKIVGDSLQIFLAFENQDQVMFKVVLASIPSLDEFTQKQPRTAIDKTQLTLSKKELQFDGLNLSVRNITIKPSPRFEQVLFLNTTSDPVSRITVADLASRKITNKYRVGCSQLSYFAMGELN